MSTAISGKPLTPSQRRRATLDRKGFTESRRLATKAPTRAFYWITASISMLILFGLIMVLSSSSIVAINRGGSAWNMFRKQATWAMFGGFAMVTTYRMPYHMWRRWVTPVLIFAFGLMFLPFVPGLGISINGARAWVSLGPINFQPSEVLKLAVLLYCCNLLGRRSGEITNLQRTFIPVIVVWGVSGALCLMQGDLGGAIVFSTIILSVLFIAGAPLRLIGASAAIAGTLGLCAVLVTATRRNRWTAFLDLNGTKGHYGYQVWESILSIANGGLLGVGAGEGTGKWGYVPLAHSDFIFAIIAEEFGLVGALGVIGGFLILAYFGIQAAIGARDPFGAVLAGGITTWFCTQAFINIGGVTGAMPVTGLTLPLISYGGSSLFMSMAAAGLLLNVARNMK